MMYIMKQRRMPYFVTLECVLAVAWSFMRSAGGQYTSTNTLLPQSNPCNYPNPKEPRFHKKCQITDPTLQRYNICDPYSAVSMTEVDVVVKHLDALNLKKSRGESCLCDSYEAPCWYRFAFAFLKNLEPPKFTIPPNISARRLCSRSNATYFGMPDGGKRIVGRERLSSVREYGNTFAKIVRKRWNYGRCGEDILILVVKNRPALLTSRKDGRLLPIIFISWGRTVEKRTKHITTTKSQTLSHVLETSNNKLDNGYSLKAILESMIDNYELLLSIADQTYTKPRNKSHIPGWALASFGACALLLLIMGAGLCLLRTGVRRGAVHKPNGADTNRRWKAGFVGGMFRKRNLKKEEPQHANVPFGGDTRVIS